MFTVTANRLRVPTLALLVVLTAACDEELSGSADSGVAEAGALDSLVEPDRAVDRALPDLPRPDSTLPDSEQPDHKLPDQAPPDKATPDATLPDLPAPDLKLPDQSLPDLPQPDQQQIDQARPDQALPDQTLPDQALPDQTPPDLPLPSCTDGIKNGAETGVDCGGTCPGCGVGLPCVKAGDCASGVCWMKICIDPKGTQCKGSGARLAPGSSFGKLRVHSTDALLRGVGSIVADPAGDLYGQDPYGNGTSGDRVLRITPAGKASSHGVPPGMSTCTVSQITIDGSGRLYLFDITSAHILRFTGAGKWTKHSSFTALGGGGSCTNTSVIGLLANPDGTLVAGSPKKGMIYRVSADGATRTLLAQVPQVFRLDHDGSGGVYAASGGKLVHVSQGGTVSAFFDPTGGPGGTSAFRRDGNGELYFHAGGSIYRLDAKATTLALEASCLAGVTDITLGKSTAAAATKPSLYVVSIGKGIAASDGDQVLELQR